MMNAPKRRVDNEISRLTDAVNLLHMHLTVIGDLTQQYRSSILKSRLALASVGVSTVAATAGAVTLGLPIQAIGGLGAIGSAACAGLMYYHNKTIVGVADQLILDQSVNATFKRLYSRRLAEKDEFTTTLWRRVQDHLVVGLTAAELSQMSKVNSAEMQRLEKIMDVDIPNLRRKSAPTFNKPFSLFS